MNTKEIKFYILGILILVFQSTVLSKYIIVFNFFPDFLTIYIILFTLKHDFKKSLYLAGILGFLQDLLIPTVIFFNFISKILIVLITENLKKKFFLSGISYKVFLIVLISCIDVMLKTGLIFIKTGIFYLSNYFIIYIILNVLIFYLIEINNKRLENQNI